MSIVQYMGLANHAAMRPVLDRKAAMQVQHKLVFDQAHEGVIDMYKQEFA